MKICFLKVLVSMLAIMTVSAHAATTLTFTEIACTNLTNITNQYAAYGVEFDHVYRYVDDRDPWKDLGTTGCGIANGYFEDATNPGESGLIMFDNPTPYVTVDWWTVSTFVMYIYAYDSAGNLVDIFSGNGSGTETLQGSNWISSMVFNDGGGFVAVANMEYEKTIEVAIDIKFCSDPNAFNCRKKGVLPVTIFGTDTVDVASIDPSTLRLCLASDMSVCTNGPKDYSYADRGNPESDLGAAQCAWEDPDGDGVFEEQDYLHPEGFLDMDAAFEASEVQAMLGDFCGDEKGAVSQALVIKGLIFGDTPFYSDPFPNVGIDQLWKVNK